MGLVWSVIGLLCAKALNSPTWVIFVDVGAHCLFYGTTLQQGSSSCVALLPYAAGSR